MKKILIAIALVLSLVAAPQLTKAATLQELQDMITALMAQVEQLKLQLTQQQSQVAQNNTQNSAGCFYSNYFNRNLDLGSKGQDVRNLQAFLKKKGFLHASIGVTGYYGQVTANAVSGFQEVQNIPASNEKRGVFGKMTSNKMNELYGCGMQGTLTNGSNNQTFVPVLSIAPANGKINRPFFETKSTYVAQILNAKPNEEILLSIKKPDGSFYQNNSDTGRLTDASGAYYMKQEMMSIPPAASAGVYTAWVTIGGIKSNVVEFTITEPTSSDINVNPIGTQSGSAYISDTIKSIAGSDAIKSIAGSAMTINHIDIQSLGLDGTYPVTVEVQVFNSSKVSMFRNNLAANINFSNVSLKLSDVQLANDGSYIFIITLNAKGTGVSSSAATSASTISTVAVVYPSGGETFITGNTYPIRWTSSGVQKVTISIGNYPSDESGDFIARNIDATTGVYNWAIPADFFSTHAFWKDGGQYKIRISDTGGYDAQIESSAFTIKSQVVATATSTLDLVVTNFSSTPANPSTSDTDPYLYVTFTYKNIGNASVNIPANTEFALMGTRSLPTSQSTIADKTKFGAIIVGVPYTLAPGESKTHTFTTMQQPAIKAIAGTMGLLMWADTGNLVKESNETNNGMYKEITIASPIVAPPTAILLVAREATTFSAPLSISNGQGNMVGRFSFVTGPTEGVAVRSVKLANAGSLIQGSSNITLGLYANSNPTAQIGTVLLTGTTQGTATLGTLGWAIPAGRVDTLIVKTLSANELATVGPGAGTYQISIKDFTWTDSMTAATASTNSITASSLPIAGQIITGLSN